MLIIYVDIVRLFDDGSCIVLCAVACGCFDDANARRARSGEGVVLQLWYLVCDESSSHVIYFDLLDDIVGANDEFALVRRVSPNMDGMLVGSCRLGG